jgi:ComF family protein
LIHTPLWTETQVIVPVPLHWKKFRRRGYNQSAVFGEGLSDAMRIPCHATALRRVTHDKSLTGMKRLQRVETIGSSYILAKPALVRHRHVLLVDDVLTTGSTLEACAQALAAAPVASIRMVTIACGEL